MVSIECGYLTHTHPTTKLSKIVTTLSRSNAAGSRVLPDPIQGEPLSQRLREGWGTASHAYCAT